MKKAKIFLTALTVLAVVGGAVAFKAVKQPFQYYTCNTLNELCEVPFIIATETTIGGIKLVPYAPYGTPCPAPLYKCETFVITAD